MKTKGLKRVWIEENLFFPTLNLATFYAFVHFTQTDYSHKHKNENYLIITNDIKLSQNL